MVKDTTVRCDCASAKRSDHEHNYWCPRWIEAAFAAARNPNPARRLCTWGCALLDGSLPRGASWLTFAEHYVEARCEQCRSAIDIELLIRTKLKLMVPTGICLDGYEALARGAEGVVDLVIHARECPMCSGEFRKVLHIPWKGTAYVVSTEVQYA